MTEFENAVITDHARGQMARRGIGESDVREILSRPDDSAPVREGRIVAKRASSRRG